MNFWTLLDTTKIPGGGELRLMQRGGEFSINLQSGVLVGSRMRGSEEALARLGCAKLQALDQPRVLIGGLGMGFTLRAALDLLPPRAEVTIAELVPGVVAWCRGPLAALSADSLADPRVSVQETDVGRLIRAGLATYDAILLDVDNGPEGMTRTDNDRLYDVDGLGAAWRALRPGGVLAVWSANPDARFTQRLKRIGFTVEEVVVHAHGTRGTRHLIWVAVRSGRQRATGSNRD